MEQPAAKKQNVGTCTRASQTDTASTKDVGCCTDICGIPLRGAHIDLLEDWIAALPAEESPVADWLKLGRESLGGAFQAPKLPAIDLTPHKKY